MLVSLVCFLQLIFLLCLRHWHVMGVILGPFTVDTDVLVLFCRHHCIQQGSGGPW